MKLRHRTMLATLGLSVATYTFLKRRTKPIPDHPYLRDRDFLVMAHRGGQGLWPPNTLFAFERAVALGVDVLEMDIHSTAEGVLVVRHDPTVDSTTDGSGYIRDYTYPELKKLDAGYNWTTDDGASYPYRGKGIRIPTLDEILNSFPRMRLNIDIKPKEPKVVDLFCKYLREHDILEQVMVGSFHYDQLQRFRRLCPEAATTASPREVALFFGLNSFFLGGVYQNYAEAFSTPEYHEGLHLITERFVRGAHAHNMQVHVWTVNEVQDMKRLIDWGVDGIITDFPDRLMTLVGSGENDKLSVKNDSLVSV
jgi:glycerophosphoryl diester phosphodiesterase